MDPGFENKSGTPDSANPITPDNAAPKTLIVGLGTGEIPDLQTALQQAQPNDTILIRHRGPLEMHPTDLTDKTPLTIRGDSVNGADYWPIIRQAKTSNVTTAGEAPAQSWIHGEKLNLKLVNLHLGVGGHARFQLESVVACKEGSIEFENCTVTASPDELTRFPAGQPFPFLISKGSDTHNVRINFTNTIIRRLSDRSWSRRHCRPLRHQLPRFFRRTIVNRHRKSSLQQMATHALAHHSRANPSDLGSLRTNQMLGHVSIHLKILS
jgi:hypothetical protein